MQFFVKSIGLIQCELEFLELLLVVSSGMGLGLVLWIMKLV